jgi:hypothetical protein
MEQRDERSTGVVRRQVLAAGAAAAVAINLNGIAVAQGSPQGGQQGAQRSTVAVEAIDGGVLLIGIERDQQNLIDPATFVALGRAFHRLRLVPLTQVALHVVL